LSDERDKTAEDDKDSKKRQRERVEALLAEKPLRTEGTARLARGTLDYTVVAQFVPAYPGALAKNEHDPQAAIFTIAYLAGNDDARDAPHENGNGRPICFAFNGGPGSSSVWLHLGAIGPKRVPINEDGTMPAPPYGLVDNHESWLEHFDLVFIDPPHTGYSQTVSEDARKKALTVDGDADALVQCIKGWLTRERRWGSALYLAGESYGTTRGAAIADKLQEAGVALAGIVLVS